ncbi:phosphoribosylanthranilate isomerase [uncultured Muriicola sp.]|uniref:phosphoribosylanthranilate isomerase n=1 Tax=uncultured Muriicola sp. TaxID=1583102 RepID=UPI002606EFAF|nr:phosphoribosylanthranilate isomerase [uncultured Muriicola sp.]
MKVKVCGMKYIENMEAVAALEPDYLGFIFWEPSKRYSTGKLPSLPLSIKRVGVFVDASIDEILEKLIQVPLDLIQLHGKETAQFCAELKEELQRLEKAHQKTKGTYKIIKAFSVGTTFTFEKLTPYESCCDYFLFDTKGPLPGGNGFTFDWHLMSSYTSDIPFFLSGGIGLANIPELSEFLASPLAQKCHAIDVNSKFEISPGLKNTKDLQIFINKLRKEN